MAVDHHGRAADVDDKANVDSAGARVEDLHRADGADGGVSSEGQGEDPVAAAEGGGAASDDVDGRGDRLAVALVAAHHGAVADGRVRCRPSPDRRVGTTLVHCDFS